MDISVTGLALAALDGVELCGKAMTARLANPQSGAGAAGAPMEASAGVGGLPMASAAFTTPAPAAGASTGASDLVRRAAEAALGLLVGGGAGEGVVAAPSGVAAAAAPPAVAAPTPAALTLAAPAAVAPIPAAPTLAPTLAAPAAAPPASSTLRLHNLLTPELLQDAAESASILEDAAGELLLFGPLQSPLETDVTGAITARFASAPSAATAAASLQGRVFDGRVVRVEWVVE